MIRIGIAGFGFMGQFHYRAYRELPGTQVGALFDLDPQAFTRAPIQGNLGSAELEGLEQASKHTDFEAFLREKLDVVDICMPTFLHCDYAQRALSSGRAVLCEKPMALTVAECEAMIEASRRAKKLLMVAQCVRFWPGYDLILSAARERKHGRLLTATLRRLGGAPTWSGWFLKEEKSGGGVMDCLVHDFDFVRAGLGKPQEVSARGTLNVLGPGSGVGYCRADLRYPDGPSCVTIEGGWVTGPAYPFSMSAFFQFEEATLAYGVDAEAPLAVYHKDGRREVPALKQGQGYVWEMRYFLECLTEGRTPQLCPPEESRDAIAMALAARDSVAAGGRPVRPA